MPSGAVRRHASSRRSSGRARTASTSCSRSATGRRVDRPHRLRRQPCVQREPAARRDQHPRAHWWRFLSTSDEYDPERLNFDKELLRRFYLKNGYADFEVTDVTSRTGARPHGVLPHLQRPRGRALPDRQGDLHFASAKRGRRVRCARTCSSTRATGTTATRSAAPRTRSSDDIHTRGYSVRPGQAATSPAMRTSTPSTSSSMSARVRGSMSSASTSSAMCAPRTRSSAASSALPRAMPSTPRRCAAAASG